MSNPENFATNNNIQKRRKIFVVPHSPTSQRFERNKIELLDSFKNWIGPLAANNSTILLHWADFLDREYTESLASLNIRIECAGYGGHANSLSSYNLVGGRPQFLRALYNLLSNCNELHILEPGTTSYYAASLGVELFIPKKKLLNEVFQLLYPDTYAGKKGQIKDFSNLNYHLEVQRKLSEYAAKEREIIALDFLGKKFVKSREKLNKILRYAPSLRTKFVNSLGTFK